MISRVIDLHTHVLAGVDDGPPTLDLAVELARAAATSGVKTIVATPHVSARYRRTSTEISEAVEVLRAALISDGVDVAIVPGAEVELTMALDLDDSKLAALRLGGGPHLLVESPLSPAADDFDPMLADVRRRGYQVVLAHPERCPAFQRSPERVERLVEQGFLCSITAGSIAGRYGGTVRKFTLELIARGWVHDISSDMHDVVRRPPGLLAEIASAERELPGLAAQSDWYTQVVPAAILAGSPLGRRPDPPQRRRRSWLRRRRA
jgi:protein-tyrosine phosphatase